MKKNTIIPIILIIILVILGIIWASKSKSVVPKDEVKTEEDITAVINEELDLIEIDVDIDSELDALDGELNTL
ncbi:MAG: hypothetical protein U9R00_00505 [Patescibacteria group bacterium]|nr:hypothetical protein [Patescibacteria group bacterium]